MNNAEFQLQALGDPRLAVHATSPLPAWLWSIDGTRVLWANPVGARVFGAANSSALAKKTFGPAEPHRRQVARLAGRLPPNGAVRLERLRGFGAAPGMLATCGCSRLEFPDGSHGILIAAANTAGRIMPLVERLQRLVEDLALPIAAFAGDGLFIGASDAARPLLGFRNLSEAGLDDARSDALKQGAVETPIGIGHMVLQRVGAAPISAWSRCWCRMPRTQRVGSRSCSRGRSKSHRRPRRRSTPSPKHLRHNANRPHRPKPRPNWRCSTPSRSRQHLDLSPQASRPKRPLPNPSSQARRPKANRR